VTDEDVKTQLLSEKDVAAEYGIPLATLRSWRFRGYGPPFYKIGSSCRYRHEDLEAWLTNCRRTSTSADKAPEDGR